MSTCAAALHNARKRTPLIHITYSYRFRSLKYLSYFLNLIHSKYCTHIQSFFWIEFLLSRKMTSTVQEEYPPKPINDSTITTTTTHEQVSYYYGQVLSTSSDLKTNACCTSSKLPRHIQKAISNIHPTVISKYYGCGLTIPTDDLTGLKILDLGCGAGRDVYILSQLVGPTGQVHGVDMTHEQLAIAYEYQSYHQTIFQHPISNVSFHLCKLEELHLLLQQEDQDQKNFHSFDIIVSNCVVNLCTDKPRVFQSCYELLKVGGEMYFADVYASRRIPPSLQSHPILYGECLSGAMYWNDFLTMVKSIGFKDPRLVDDSLITIENDELQQVLDSSSQGKIEFYSATYRLFKLLPESLEPYCEDYGQAVIYKGTIGPGYESVWSLDGHHTMETGKVFSVCGNTFHMLYDTRLRKYFDFIGDFTKHYGIFEGCGTSIPFASAKQQQGSGGTCGGGSCC